MVDTKSQYFNTAFNIKSENIMHLLSVNFVNNLSGSPGALKEAGAVLCVSGLAVVFLCSGRGGSQGKAAQHTSACPSGSAGTVGKGAIPATDNSLGWDSLLSTSHTCALHTFAAELGTLEVMIYF